MSALASAAQASVCAVFFATQGGGLSLVWQASLDQTALDLVHAAWARKREELEAGRMVRYGLALVWPLFDGPRLVALAYFNSAIEEFPTEASRADAALLAARLATMRPEIALSSYMATGLSQPGAVEEVKRDQIYVAVDACQGNVSLAARRLGLTRQALYLRAAKLDVDIAAIRVRYRGRK